MITIGLHGCKIYKESQEFRGLSVKNASLTISTPSSTILLKGDFQGFQINSG